MAEEKKKKKHARHGYHRTEIEHHDDNSHTVRHIPHSDHAHEMPVKSYATADLDGVHDGLIDHMGEPNPGEEQDQQAPPAPQE